MRTPKDLIVVMLPTRFYDFDKSYLNAEIG